MGKTSIEWTDYTFNPWWGCTKVSPGCDNCYAEAFDRRVGGRHWGPMQPRRTMSEAYWHAPRRWDRKAKETGRSARVFAASMADVFDVEAPAGARERLWDVIRSTPHLDWLLLTKRPQMAARMLPDDWGSGWPNVWLGTSVENQTEADRRIPHLLAIPAAVRFLSCEPLIGPVTLGAALGWRGARGVLADRPLDAIHAENLRDSGIDWVIVGGESGPRARPMDLAWARSLVEQCRAASVAIFVKQLGSRPEEDRAMVPLVAEPHGRDMDEWPEDMRIREWPEGRR